MQQFAPLTPHPTFPSAQSPAVVTPPATPATIGIEAPNFSITETRQRTYRGSHITIVNQSYEYDAQDGSPPTAEYREFVLLKKMAATILPVCPRSGKYLLIRQFRYPAHLNAQLNGGLPSGPLTSVNSGNQPNDGGWLYETIAGVIEPGDSALDTAVREAQEEGNITIDPGDVREVHKAFMTPGVTNEEITFFLAIVDKPGPDGPGGLVNEGEKIRAKWMTQDEIRQLAANGQIRDAKTLICLYAAKVL